MSILLTGTNESLQVVLDAAPASNQLPCTASYADQNGSGGDNTINTNGTTPVTLVAAPSASVSRVINDVVIPNADTATRIVTVNKLISGTPFRLVRITLLAGYSLGYGGGRWYVIDPSGNFLETVQAQQSGSWSVSVAGTPDVNVKNVGGSAITLGQKASTSSLPVVIASDQSPVTFRGVATGIGASLLNSTANVNFGAAATTSIRGLSVTYMGATAPSSINLIITDGGGTIRVFLNLPMPSSGTFYFQFAEWPDLSIALVNGGVSPYMSLSANLTSGFISVTYSLS